MKTTRKSTTDNSTDTTNTTIDKVTEKAKEVGSALSQQASETLEAGKEEAAIRLEEGKESAVAQVRDLDQALRETADQVENPALGRQIHRLADGVEKVASSLEATQYEDVIRSVERLSRTSPTLFLAGSFAVGLAAARFLRATSRRYDEVGQQGAWPYESSKSLV